MAIFTETFVDLENLRTLSGTTKACGGIRVEQIGQNPAGLQETAGLA